MGNQYLALAQFLQCPNHMVIPRSRPYRGRGHTEVEAIPRHQGTKAPSLDATRYQSIKTPFQDVCEAPRHQAYNGLYVFTPWYIKPSASSGLIHCRSSFDPLIKPLFFNSFRSLHIIACLSLHGLIK